VRWLIRAESAILLSTERNTDQNRGRITRSATDLDRRDPSANINTYPNQAP
jgi:hypothetical protein